MDGNGAGRAVEVGPVREEQGADRVDWNTLKLRPRLALAVQVWAGPGSTQSGKNQKNK